MIEVLSLTKNFGSFTAVDGLTLTVQKGETLGLVGPNGAGKTTTLRCLTGILPPTMGSIAIAGHDLLKNPVEAKRSFAFVPDEPRLFEYLTVWDHLTMAARLYGVPDGKKRAEALLEELELSDRRNAFPAELSRGMKQKLMVAAAMLHRPEALLLDEPLTGLDPVAIRAMKERIRRVTETGTAVMISSHLLHLVEELCHRIVILARGTKVAEGSLDEIRASLPDLEEEADLEEIFIRATRKGTIE